MQHQLPPGFDPAQLDSLLQQHPYFAAGRALAAKLATDARRPQAQALITRAAAYAPSRQNLKAFIEAPALAGAVELANGWPAESMAAAAPVIDREEADLLTQTYEPENLSQPVVDSYQPEAEELSLNATGEVANAPVSAIEDYEAAGVDEALLFAEEKENPLAELATPPVHQEEALAEAAPVADLSVEEETNALPVNPFAAAPLATELGQAESPTHNEDHFASPGPAADFFEKVHVEVGAQSPATAAAAAPAAGQKETVDQLLTHVVADMEHDSEVIDAAEKDEMDEIERLIAEMRRHRAQAIDVLEHPDHAAQVAADIKAEETGLPVPPATAEASTDPDFFAVSREANQSFYQDLATVAAPQLEQEPVQPQPLSAPAGNRKPVNPRRKLQASIIEDFLEANPSIAVTNLNDEIQETEDLAAPAKVKPSLATEAMAKLYIKQGRNAEAIAVYEQLMSRKPEKTEYYQSKINELKGAV